MDVIVERLRALLTAAHLPERRATIEEAADEIERLRARYDAATDQVVRYADEIERLRADIKTLFENNGYLSSALAKAEAEIERLRAALQRLVTDYEDVPDPTDADGQAVFEDARRALEPKP